LFAADLPAAKTWYTQLLGIEPYFQMPTEGPPAYVEFRIGDYQHELGVMDARFAPHGPAPQPAGVVAFWHVDDVAAALVLLLSMGATVHENVTDRGEGFTTASVVDPFGNMVGVMHNPHYLDVLASIAGMGGTPAPG